MAADRNSPEYLEELAERADPDQLWRLDPFAQLDLPADQRKQLDTAVALRRYASVIRDMERAHEQNKSLVLTRLGPSVTDRAFIPMKKRHLESVERARGVGGTLPPSTDSAGWCRVCSHGNDRLGKLHLSSCPSKPAGVGEVGRG